ncbi:hypothetical protein BJ684DRAFT_14805 [Piptocephalis cylindrospora]|uniref:Uncharacterized protein n=1 Tax=Piptocephalis cylindrospora TaxID=1907219 RepID=A0A4P9Y705_9FUNG|nr:hypothetical protein BJ684DRAFT_14805 [Piptocephalis cylindrospora]|eukprot:RKP14896.1 hypothetical protein BJ684DRAFT_14805 [Piptocephalis cylindrospora]
MALPRFPRVVEACSSPDASCSMLQETVLVPRGQEMVETSSLQLALDAVMAVAQDQAYSHHAQALGVLLYNTRECRNEFDLPYIYELVSLRQCTMSILAELSTILTGIAPNIPIYPSSPQGRDRRRWETSFGWQNAFFRDGELWWLRPTEGKRIILITDQKIPHPHGSDLHNQVMIRTREVAKDWAFINTHVLWSKEEEKKHSEEGEDEEEEEETEETIGHKMYTFMVGEESSRFPGSRVSVSVHGQGAKRLEDMAEYIRFRQRSPLATFRLPLQLSSSYTVGVSGYMEYAPTDMPKTQTMWVNSRRAGRPMAYPVKPRLSIFTQNPKALIQDEVEEEERVKVPEKDVALIFRYKLSDGTTDMGSEEREALQKYNADKIILIRWMDKKGVHPQNHILPPIFLRGDELALSGSREMLRVLIDTLLDMSLVGVVKYPSIPHCTPRLGLIVPQSRRKDGLEKEGMLGRILVDFTSFPFPTWMKLQTRTSSGVTGEEGTSPQKENVGAERASQVERSLLRSIIHRHTQSNEYNPIMDDISDTKKALGRLFDVLMKKESPFPEEQVNEDEVMGEPTNAPGLAETIGLDDEEVKVDSSLGMNDDASYSSAVTSWSTRKRAYVIEDDDGENENSEGKKKKRALVGESGVTKRKGYCARGTLGICEGNNKQGKDGDGCKRGKMKRHTRPIGESLEGRSRTGVWRSFWSKGEMDGGEGGILDKGFKITEFP